MRRMRPVEKVSMTIEWFLLGLLLVGALAGCSSQPIVPVDHSYNKMNSGYANEADR